MSEPATKGPQEPSQNKGHQAISQDSLSPQRDWSGTAVEIQTTQPLFTPHHTDSHPAPRWLRPFFSMRVQLTFACCIVLILMVSFTSLMLYRQPSQLYALILTLAVILVGSALIFIFISLLLSPLRQVTDAAQAIAIGDLAQRTRLPLRLPPQDEIDRLAGSINEMVTRLEYAEEMQTASEERFRQFFSDASHQLRTPLTSIRGFTDLLTRKAKDDPEVSAHILRRMQSETLRMTNLINDLLTLARLDDRHPLKLQYLDLVELAIEATEQTRSRADDNRKITLEINTQERLGIQADKNRIKQLLFILLDNALKYGRAADQGLITLKLDKHNDQAVIFIYDNGDGIAKDDLAHIFEAFYRGRHRTPTHGMTAIGTGLGLSIASGIVRAHNGSITVCSELEKGTEFKVTLPSAG